MQAAAALHAAPHAAHQHTGQRLPHQQTLTWRTDVHLLTAMASSSVRYQHIEWLSSGNNTSNRVLR